MADFKLERTNGLRLLTDQARPKNGLIQVEQVGERYDVGQMDLVTLWSPTKSMIQESGSRKPRSRFLLCVFLLNCMMLILRNPKAHTAGNFRLYQVRICVLHPIYVTIGIVEYKTNTTGAPARSVLTGFHAYKLANNYKMQEFIIFTKFATISSPPMSVVAHYNSIVANCMRSAQITFL